MLETNSGSELLRTVRLVEAGATPPPGAVVWGGGGSAAAAADSGADGGKGSGRAAADDNDGGDGASPTSSKMRLSRVALNPSAMSMSAQGGAQDVGTYCVAYESCSSIHGRRIIEPSAPVKIAWDLFVGAVTLANVLLIAVQIGFPNWESVTSGWWDWFMDGVFWCDILVNFRAAYYDEGGVLVTVPSLIRRKYLRGFFMLDFFTTLPITKISSIISDNKRNNSTKSLKFFRIFRLVKLLKLVQVLRGSVMREIQSYLIDVPPLVFKATSMFMMLVLLAHFFGCFWNFFDKVMCENAGAEFNLYVGSAPWDPNVRADHEYTEFWEKYVKGVYWAFTTMTTVGYGDILPSCDTSRWYAVLIMLLGATVFGYIVGSASALATNPHTASAREQTRIMSYNNYFEEKTLPRAVRSQILDYVGYAIQCKTIFDETWVFEKLPLPLRTTLVHFVHREAINKIPMFHSSEPTDPHAWAVSLVVQQMIPNSTRQGNFVYAPFENPRALFFVLKGQLMYVRMALGSDGPTPHDVPGSWITPGKVVGCEDILFGRPDVGAKALENSFMYCLTLEAIGRLVSDDGIVSHSMAAMLHECVDAQNFVQQMQTEHSYSTMADAQTEEKAPDSDAAAAMTSHRNRGSPAKIDENDDPNQYLRWVHDHRVRRDDDLQLRRPSLRGSGELRRPSLGDPPRRPSLGDQPKRSTLRGSMDRDRPPIREAGGVDALLLAARQAHASAVTPSVGPPCDLAGKPARAREQKTPEE